MSESGQTQRVSLGCGTLILIGIIVLIFSSGHNEKTVKELSSLRTEISQLQQTVEKQTHEITVLQEKIEKVNQQLQE